LLENKDGIFREEVFTRLEPVVLKFANKHFGTETLSRLMQVFSYKINDEEE